MGLVLGPSLCSYESRGSLNLKAGLRAQNPTLSFEKREISKKKEKFLILHLFFCLKLSTF